MSTYIFNIPSFILVPFGVENISKFKSVESNTFGRSDGYKILSIFSIGNNIERTNSNLKIFTIRSTIRLSLNVYNFNLKSIYNKGQAAISRVFNHPYKINRNTTRLYTFNIKNKIYRQENIVEKLFNIKSSISKVLVKSYIFNIGNKINYSGIISKNFNIGYTLESGGTKYGVFTLDNSAGSIRNGTYSIDGITSGLGDITEILSTQMAVPIIIYVVVCNGSFSNFRTGRFEIKESTKNTTMSDNNISVVLSGSRLSISTKIDKTSPVSFKIIRGSA